MADTQYSGEKKLTLLLLCWLFGILAVHRFYTGKYVSGGLQLLSLTMAAVLGLIKVERVATILILIFFLWWIIDVMLIIMGKFTDKEGRPITDWV